MLGFGGDLFVYLAHVSRRSTRKLFHKSIWLERLRAFSVVGMQRVVVILNRAIDPIAAHVPLEEHLQCAPSRSVPGRHAIAVPLIAGSDSPIQWRLRRLRNPCCRF